MRKICMMVTNSCVNDARVLKEASTLSNDGNEVSILAIAGNNLPILESVDKFTIKRINRRFLPNSLLGKLELLFKFIIFGIKEKSDIYHAHDLSTLLECFIVSKIIKSKVVYDSHELFISSYGKEKLGKKMYGFLEKLLIKRVHAIITVNKYIGDILSSKYGLLTSPVIVMNCPELDNSDIESENNIINSDKKTILYQGTMQNGRGLKELISSMNYLSNDYCLLMIGDGYLRDELEKLSCHKSNICFTGMVPFRELPKYTASANLGIIVFENESWNNYYASPNKLFEYIQSEIPILAPNYPFINDIITQYDIGVLIDEINPKIIAEAIVSIFSDTERYLKMKQNTKFAKNHLNWEQEEKKLIDLYEQI